MSIYTIEKGYQKKRSFKRPILVTAVFLVIGGSDVFLKSLIPSGHGLSQTSSSVSAHASAPIRLTQPVAWPAYGESAYAVAGQGVVASSNDSAQPVPTASLAKIITALAVLKQKPLKDGEQGPLITITQDDIAIYENYVRNDGSVVPVEVGEQISEYQALQAMLLPSANNIADALAKWAFGSTENYTTYANKMLQDMGLSKTHVTDASGFSASTTSTAHDMSQLGISFVQNSILKGIAEQQEATIPFAGIIKNYNALVNKDGILGLKIGNTDEAGRCFVVADVRSGGKPTSVVAVLGAPNLQTAMADAVVSLRTGNQAYDTAMANQP